VILYLDTEFTDLAVHSRLLSIGIVGPSGRGVSFYAEVTDRDRLDGASWFAVAHVLPQFGRAPQASCTYAELGRRLGTFLGKLTSSLAPGERIDVAHGYHLDWDLLALALRDGAGPRGAQVMRRIRPLNVYSIVRRAAGGEGPLNRPASGSVPPSAHHHALADARTLRHVCEAACDRRSNARPSTRPVASAIGIGRATAA
jgi:3' exoribonuclease, RNase T-like